MATRAEDLLHRWTGESVPVSFNAGFVALSYGISLLGGWSTLELINRRTSMKGWYNHLLLAGAAISMGGIAIWSMHFIGNRSIILLNGEPELQLAYSIAITAVSFFVPIAVLLIAFIAVNANNQVKWWRVGLSGSLSGSAICGMHYLGDRAISNYECHYVVANVVGAAAIAASASTVALSLFFVFRAAWTNSALRRAGCAVVLAGAVSGMHWCASLGTSYTLLHGASQDGDGASRTNTVIIIICLAVAASALMIATAVLTARTMKGYAAKAQQIVLAAAVFDKQGRILVTPEGLLPSEKITETFPQKVSQDDIFSTAHPLFHWMYRASRNWSSVSALLGWMMTHLDSFPQSRRGGRSGIHLIQENGQLVPNYDVIFRELFCMAASSLATRMTDDLLKVGSLWGEIFHTGMENRPSRPTTRLSTTMNGLLAANKTDTPRPKSRDTQHDEADLLEKGMGKHNEAYGRGSLMFLVRHVDNPNDIARLEAAGFRFAETHRVVDIIGSSMQIKTRHLEEKLRAMASHSDVDSLPEPGVHVSFFAVRARLDKFGFDVMVDRNTRSTLPTAKLPYKKLEPWQEEFLRNLDDLPLQTLLIRLAMMEDGTPREVQFAAQLRSAIAGLRSDIDDVCLDKAKLCSRVVQMPFRPTPDRSASCTLITLQLVLDINSRVRSRRCDFIPLQFFKVHNMVHPNSSHHAAFSRALHRDMSAVLTMMPTQVKPGSGHGHDHASSSSTLNLTADECVVPSSGSSGRASPTPTTTTDETSRRESRQQKPSLFGGIMVSQEIAIQVSEVNPQQEKLSSKVGSRFKKSAGVVSKPRPEEKDKLGIQVKAVPRNGAIEMERVTTPTMNLFGGAGGFGAPNIQAVEKEEEATTFVDELFQACFERRP